MPIRQRGASWQVDVRLPDGKRYRTTVKTEAEAVELEASLKTNPKQRRAMKRALRPSPGASKAAAQPSAESSQSDSEGSDRMKSKVITLQTLAEKLASTLSVTGTS
jgi:hypothetical protein